MGYGLGGGAGPDMTGTPIQATDWTLDNWGELLIATPESGGLYYWGPNSGFTNMSLVVDAQIHSTGSFVSQAQQQIIVYGASVNAWDPTTQNSGIAGIGIYQDPMLIQWSDLGNFFQWVADITTQAGNFRVPLGSKLVGACATKNRNLFWTDLDLWSGSYVNQPGIYQHNPVGTRCGLIGKHAFTQFADAVYWMGQNNFFVYAGAGVTVIPCSVWDKVFQDLDATWLGQRTRDAFELALRQPNALGGRHAMKNTRPRRTSKSGSANLRTPPARDGAASRRNNTIGNTLLGNPA